MRDRVINEYFKWLSDIVCGERYSKLISYNKLLIQLHEIEFRYSIPKDQNRYEDGENLRYRFASREYPNDEELIIDILDRPCTVLEMMVALAIRCEEAIMDDPRVGDRTGQWFWGMIVNLGLGAMTDTRFDRLQVEEAINRFLDRDYEPDGRGGLFRCRHAYGDMRTIEIWHQLCWYLDEIV